MQEFNKFRVITVGFILMFVFAIAAMYTNTKDITTQKMKNSEISKNNIDETLYNNNNIKFHRKSSEIASEQEIDILTARVEQLELSLQKLSRDVSASNTSGLNCQIRGVLNDGEVVPLSPSESIEEANINKREMVITCIVK